MTPEVPQELRKDIGRRIKALRKAKSWSRAEVAGMCGVSVSALGQWERGERLINLPAAIVLVTETEVSFDYLLLGDERRLPLEIAKEVVPPDRLFRNRIKD